MKIYTRQGDQGETALLSGNRVSKHHLRIESYGTIDELNAFIGLIRDVADHASAHNQLLAIQHHLFTIGSVLASEGQSKLPLPEIKQAHIDELESQMDRMDQELPPLKNFILPGGDAAASYCHVARTITRRAERKTVALARSVHVEPIVISYLNRLSDYFFVLARYYTHQHNGEETIWKTGG
ncbi:MAG: cob(I)yrinic acid a,c-diamide adenosyltransferase [Schleiferiaceae bacterium]|jgi:cob(I)alamin adenosyltransferase|nr:cob(I)yrinic acid a,c-diamide adenosyltransferase [Schleiferiaceae bacterium]